MGYKKIIKSRSLRMKILNSLRFIPDKFMIKLQYYIKLKRKLNLSTPRRFTEKIQWYKLNYRLPVLKQCVDKYLVRDYVKLKGLDHTLNTLYGVYYNYKDIIINELPDRFVIKSTNGGGGINVILCDGKEKLDYQALEETVKSWLKPKGISGGREWAYYGLKPKIIIEEYLSNEVCPEEGIIDYKFFCFNGKVKYLVVDIDRYTNHKRDFYDKDWNYIDVSSDCPNTGDKVPRPDGLDEMLKVAAKLSEDFPFVRVDLYYVSGKVIFGELTFYPWSGYVQFQPDNFDYHLGKFFELPRVVRR